MRGDARDEGVVLVHQQPRVRGETGVEVADDAVGREAAIEGVAGDEYLKEWNLKPGGAEGGAVGVLEVGVGSGGRCGEGTLCGLSRSRGRGGGWRWGR